MSDVIAPEVNPLYRAGDDKYGTEYDTTQLREGGHGRYVHRDYLAHCLRWGWTSRHVAWGDNILDFGCGQDVALYGILAKMNSFLPPRREDRSVGQRPRYSPVDLNKFAKATGAAWCDPHPETNLVDEPERRKELVAWGDYDLVTSFEVIEHMSVANGDRYLAAIHEALADDGRVFISTPVFNGRAAKNHIHEYTIPELQAKFEAAGFSVADRWGTFMSWNDMKKVAPPSEVALMTELREHIGSEVAACVLASKYPDASRNNTWVLTKR